MSEKAEHLVFAANLADVQSTGCKVVQLEGHTLALFAFEDEIHAVDNRCPHMGFPLHQGTVKDGILTCHWQVRMAIHTGPFLSKEATVRFSDLAFSRSFPVR